MGKHTDEDEKDIMYDEDLSESSLKPKDDKKLREELKKTQTEAKEYLAGWQRAKADLVNYKREMEERRGEFAMFAVLDFVHELLPALDSFDMAFRNKDTWEKADETWRKGIEYIYAQLLSALEARGVRQINPLHEIFNPREHDSLGTTTVTKKEDDQKITEVIQKGYRLHDKLIRPAKVHIGEFQENI